MRSSLPSIHPSIHPPPIAASTVHLQRNLVAANIEVVFPNPCATLPLDRTGNGWTSFGPTNDGYTGDLTIPFTFSLVGETYRNLRIFDNGFIQFPGSAVDSNVLGFYTGIDTRGDASGLVWYKTIGMNTFAAAWDRVGVFEKDDSGPNTFQIMISDGTNPDMGMGNNVCLCYKDMGSRVLYGANVGVSNSAGAYFPLGFFDHPGTDYDGPDGINDGWDHLENKSICFHR